MSLVDMQGKVAMMTGGARGIGRGIITTLTGAGANVAIAVMCPGQTQTLLVEEMQPQEFSSRVLGHMEQYVPLGRLGRPEDIAPTVVLLASDAAGFITGQVISISGGLTMVR